VSRSLRKWQKAVRNCSIQIFLSTTGVAGPRKGEDGKEVGTVFYTIRIKDQEVTSKLYMPHLDRLDFMHFVSQKVIQDLVALLVNN
jgi:nicotinamide-nucleotide amidase